MIDMRRSGVDLGLYKIVMRGCFGVKRLVTPDQ